MLRVRQSLTAKIPACHRAPFGFSMIEAVMVLLIIATVVGALTPSVIRTISHARVNRAASVVAADFYQAQSLSARSRKPVRVTVDSTARSVTLADAQTGSTLTVRHFDVTSEFKLPRLFGTPASILVFPSAMSSVAIAVTVGDATYFRIVNVSRAGQVRIQ